MKARVARSPGERPFRTNRIYAPHRVRAGASRRFPPPAATSTGRRTDPAAIRSGATTSTSRRSAAPSSPHGPTHATSCRAPIRARQGQTTTTTASTSTSPAPTCRTTSTRRRTRPRPSATPAFRRADWTRTSTQRAAELAPKNGERPALGRALTITIGRPTVECSVHLCLDLISKLPVA